VLFIEKSSRSGFMKSGSRHVAEKNTSEEKNLLVWTRFIVLWPLKTSRLKEKHPAEEGLKCKTRIPECPSLCRNWVPPPPQSSVFLPSDPKGGGGSKTKLACSGVGGRTYFGRLDRKTKENSTNMKFLPFSGTVDTRHRMVTWKHKMDNFAALSDQPLI
jgi:hypothetical protein